MTYTFDLELGEILGFRLGYCAPQTLLHIPPHNKSTIYKLTTRRSAKCCELVDLLKGLIRRTCPEWVG